MSPNIFPLLLWATLILGILFVVPMFVLWLKEWYVKFKRRHEHANT